jgi:hypothetical protein
VFPTQIWILEAQQDCMIEYFSCKRGLKECHCKITPTVEIITWLSFAESITLPPRKSNPNWQFVLLFYHFGQ